MAARVSPTEALRVLNESARAGHLNVLDFLEQHFTIQGYFLPKPIHFEEWQRGKVLGPVFEKHRGRRQFDTYLNGLPKKNGKSTLAACVAVGALLVDDPNPEVYSAAGDKDQARIVFNTTKRAFERSSKLRPLVKLYKDAIERIDKNGFYKALSSDSSTTHGLNPSCVIWDELWNQPSYDLWEALTHSPSRENPFHFIVTYAGTQARRGNLLYDLYSRGLRGDPRMYMFWSSGEDANLASWITAEYLEGQRSSLPEDSYRRLHRNEWRSNETERVFRIPAECWGGTFENFMGDTPNAYRAGIDLAKIHDFTAWAIIRKDNQPYRLVEFGKLPHMDYTKQVELLAATLKRFGNPKTLVDAGAAGTVVIELMRQCGLNVEEFKFTSDSKAQLVTSLAVGFEQRKLQLPRSGRTHDESRAVEDLEAELYNFEPKVLDSGTVRYEASGGYHDDLVMALCLAYAGASHVRRVPIIEVIDCSRRSNDPDSRYTWYSIG